MTLKPRAHHYSSQYELRICQGSGTGHYWSVVFPESGKEPLFESELTDNRDDAFRKACDWVDSATERQLEAALEAYWKEQP